MRMQSVLQIFAVLQLSFDAVEDYISLFGVFVNHVASFRRRFMSVPVLRLTGHILRGRDNMTIIGNRMVSFFALGCRDSRNCEEGDPYDKEDQSAHSPKDSLTLFARPAIPWISEGIMIFVA